MTSDRLRRALTHPAARDARHQLPFALWLPDGSRPLDREQPPAGVSPRPAAVLIPVFRRDGTTRVIMTRRTDTVDHPGQISFPGGRLDADDTSLLATALRETEEEVGISPDEVEVLGRLGEVYIWRTNYRVTPYVGWLDAPPHRYRLNPIEVAEVLEVSLDQLLDPGSLRRDLWTLGGQPYLVRYFRHRDGGDRTHDIWGASARMLAMLVAALRAVTPDDTNA